MATRRTRTLQTLLTIALCAGATFGCTSDSSSTAGETAPGAAKAESSAEPPIGNAAESTVAGDDESDSSTSASDVVTDAGGNDQPAGEPPFVLQGNGVDDIRFGNDLETVRTMLKARHGEPDDDSGWLEQQAPCEGLGSMARMLTWGNLVLAFSNGPTEYGPVDSEHLIAYYSADEPDPAGAVGPDNLPLLDQTVASLRARFPGATFTMNEIAGPEYQLPGNLQGSLSGLADSDTSQTFRVGLICID